MNRFFTFLVAALFAVNNVTAFTSLKTPAATLVSKSMPIATTSSSSSPFSAESSSTALHLKVKVDPNAAKNNNALGNSKAAAYGGSIAVAALLPVVFLVWAALK